MMEHVLVESVRGGFSLDPRPYLERLPVLAERLPPGAAAFALDPDHYDFGSVRCVKDLRLSALVVRDSVDRLSVELQLGPNRFKHDVGLVITYRDVTALVVEPGHRGALDGGWADTRLGSVQLDEIVPHADGCSHEIALTDGRIRVTAADLTARWQESV